MDALKTAVVLLVEDDLGDRKLVKKALANLETPNDLYVTASGEGGLEYLQRSKSGDAVCPRPNLILLDLNMPGMGGKEFLRRIKADDDLCAIPVVVLTVSDAEADIQECYRLHTAGYIQKSTSPERFQEVVCKLAKYWFETSSLAKS